MNHPSTGVDRDPYQENPRYRKTRMGKRDVRGFLRPQPQRRPPPISTRLYKLFDPSDAFNNGQNAKHPAEKNEDPENIKRAHGEKAAPSAGSSFTDAQKTKFKSKGIFELKGVRRVLVFTHKFKCCGDKRLRREFNFIGRYCKNGKECPCAHFHTWEQITTDPDNQKVTIRWVKDHKSTLKFVNGCGSSLTG